jgi:hypothetical protein
MVRANTTTLASNANISSAPFTVTNAKVIDGVMLWLMNNQASPAGTLQVDLQKYVTSPDVPVTQATVTINTADLPHSATGTNDVLAVVPVFLKFASTATGDGTANWTLKLTCSNTSGNGITYSRNSATAGDFTRALRTTTAATPAAADDLYIVGELTGAGTHNSRTVTMDSTATTAYGNGSVNSTSVNGGGVRIGSYGTLTYGTTASTNYVLRVNGDVEVYWQGTLTIGASGSEIPRTSTAVLELQMASASGDFGVQVHNIGTFNSAGLSRTSGKNVVKCLLNGDLTGSCVLTSGPTATNATNTALGSLDAGGTSLLASSVADTVTSATHSLAWSGPSITNTTQVAQAWLARGSGTNNRFVRLCAGNNTVFSSVTNGFYADIDLQSGTIGTCTAIGTGTATSATITAVGTGYVCTITGKVSSTAATPSVLINICSAAGTTSFAGAANQSLLYEGVQLVTASSISTTLSVDTDTGWLSGDAICVAATTRTAADCEDFVLNANAGASSMATALYPFGYGGPTTSITGTHSGTSPTQGEIGLLTRNVKIRSTSNSLWSYVYCESLATATVSWAEFYYLGLNSNPKYGVAVQAAASGNANAKSFTYCSAHDVYSGFFSNTTTGNSINFTASYNIVWNTTGPAMGLFSSVATISDWTFDNNLLMKAGTHGFFLGDIGGTFTNNTSVGGSGGASVGINLVATGSVSAYTPLGTFSGNTVHSQAGTAVSIGTQTIKGTISGLVVWRNNATGLNINIGSTDGSQLFFSNPTFFGNTTQNISIVGGDAINITGGSISADVSFSTNYGIVFPSGQPVLANIFGVDFSGTGTGLAAHSTSDLLTSTTAINYLLGIINNCKFGAGSVAGIGSSNKSLWAPSGPYFSFEKYNQTAGDHRTEMTYGQLKTDSTIYNTASPSMRMTPNNASNKLESAPKNRGILKKATNSATTAISVYVRESATGSGDSASYNGNPPRLIQRANAALGQTSDVVLATASTSPDIGGSWRQLSGTSSSATDDGEWEFIIDCDGTTGWVNVDDWA